MEKIRNTKILGIVGNVLIIISLFLNWATVKSTIIDYSLTEQLKNTVNGALIFLMSIFSLIVIFGENISPKFFKGLTNVKLTLISSIVELLILVPIIINIINMEPTNEGFTIQFGWGFYLMCVGVFLSLIFPFVYKKQEKDLSETENNTENKTEN